MSYKVIALSGQHGCGTSTVAKRLSKLIPNAVVISFGGIWRETVQQGIAISPIMNAKVDSKIELKVMEAYGDRKSTVIIDGSIRGILFSNQFFNNPEEILRVFLTATLEDRVNRLKERGEVLVERLIKERPYNLKRYGCTDTSMMQQASADMILSSSKLNVDQIVSAILMVYQNGGMRSEDSTYIE